MSSRHVATEIYWRELVITKLFSDRCNLLRPKFRDNLQLTVACAPDVGHENEKRVSNDGHSGKARVDRTSVKQIKMKFYSVLAVAAVYGGPMTNFASVARIRLCWVISDRKKCWSLCLRWCISARLLSESWSLMNVEFYRLVAKAVFKFVLGLPGSGIIFPNLIGTYSNLDYPFVMRYRGLRYHLTNPVRFRLRICLWLRLSASDFWVNSASTKSHPFGTSSACKWACDDLYWGLQTAGAFVICESVLLLSLT